MQIIWQTLDRLGLSEARKRKPVPTIVAMSGTENGGGTGGGKLIESSKSGVINMKVVGVLSTHSRGGARRKAEEHAIPFFLLSEGNYREVLQQTGAKYMIFCGWDKDIVGINPARTIAIERGKRSSDYHHAHENDLQLYLQGKTLTSDIIFRFVTGPTVSDGPEIIRIPVPIHINFENRLLSIMESESYRIPQQRFARVVKELLREAQNHYAFQIINQVIEDLVRWDGINPSSLRYPQAEYEQLIASLRIWQNAR